MSEEKRKELDYKFGPTDDQIAEASKLYLEETIGLLKGVGGDSEKFKKVAKDVDRAMNTLRTNAQFDDNRRRLDAKTPTSIVHIDELAKELGELIGDSDES